MILWKTAELSAALKNQLLPERKKFHYLFVSTLIYALVSSSFLDTKDAPSAVDHITDIFIILAAAAGMCLAYRENVRGDNKFFIERAICLSLPIALKTLLLTLGLTIPIFALIGFLGGSEKLEKVAFFFIEALFQIIFYWRLCVWIRRTSS